MDRLQTNLKAAMLVASVLLGGCGQGEPGPLGPAGPPGEPVRGASYVAHFDRAADLDTWEFKVQGDWRVEAGQLLLTAQPGERSVIGPTAMFSGDLDVSVLTRPVVGELDLLTYGLRFHAGDNGAYELYVRDGTYGLIRENGDGSTVSVVSQTPRAELKSDREVQLRVVVRGTELSIYVGGRLVRRERDAGPRTGKIRVFVEVSPSTSPVRRGPGSVLFDELWVNTALPLL